MNKKQITRNCLHSIPVAMHKNQDPRSCYKPMNNSIGLYPSNPPINQSTVYKVRQA